MWLLLLEAGSAGLLLIFIVWWTMYAGAKPQKPTQTAAPKPPPADGASDGSDAGDAQRPS